MSFAHSSTVVSGSAGTSASRASSAFPTGPEIQLRDEAADGLYAVRSDTVSGPTAALRDLRMVPPPRSVRAALVVVHRVAGHAEETPDLVSGAVFRVVQDIFGQSTGRRMAQNRLSPVCEG